MFGTEMLIDALLNTVGIDKTQATALFQRIQTEAPELLASIRGFVETTNKRLENIEAALAVLLNDRHAIAGPKSDNFTAHESLVKRHPDGCICDTCNRHGELISGVQ